MSTMACQSFCVACGCTVDGAEKKHRMVLRGPEVQHDVYPLWEEFFKKKVIESGRDLGDFSHHLSSTRMYMCRACKESYIKLYNVQKKVFERVENAVIMVEECVRNDTTRKRKAPAPLRNVPPAKRPLFVGSSPPVVVCKCLLLYT